MHFLFSVYGMITVFLVTLLGGLQQGLGQEDWRQPWMVAAAGANPYAVATTFAWCLILFSNVFFFLHLALMWLRWAGSFPRLRCRVLRTDPSLMMKRTLATMPPRTTPPRTHIEWQISIIRFSQ